MGTLLLWRAGDTSTVVQHLCSSPAAGQPTSSRKSLRASSALPAIHVPRYTVPTVADTPTPHISEELALEMRRLAHDLSNALEVIVQTSYLLGMAELKEPASDWLRMLDSGVQKALDINLELRETIKKNTSH